MPLHSTSFDLSSPELSARYAVALAAELEPGDTVLLHGTVGAGKTHFARHMIQSLLDEQEDVPSPTFTLVQSYDTKAGTLWHADLYRIGSVFEIEELGLSEAFETAICVVEWPDRLGDLEPPDALTLYLSDGPTDESRRLTANWTNDRWTTLMKTWGMT